MASSIATTKVGVHSRSTSFPASLARSHPLNASVEEHLCRLRIPEETSSSSLSIKCNKLSALKNLYESVYELLQLPSTQQNHLSSGEDVLSGSLRLLDLCSILRDAFLQMRASMQDLESSLRRREADVSSKAGSYLICKKKAYKMISKYIASSKKLKINKSIHTPAIVSLLREVEEVSITVFESIVASIFPAKETSKQNRWSLVFKSTQSKREEDSMDTALEAICKKLSSKDSNILRTQQVQKYLMAIDMNMQKCEEELDSLSRSLIKSRVSLLNVLSH